MVVRRADCTKGYKVINLLNLFKMNRYRSIIVMDLYMTEKKQEQNG